MCMFGPKIPKPVPPAQMQAMQNPKDMLANKGGSKDARRRRGMWASIFTGPQGATGTPMTTGTGGGITGG